MVDKRPVKVQRPAALSSALASLAGLAEVEVKITLELGRTEITLEEAMSLGERSMLVVEKMADEPVDVCVNGKLFGRGRLVLMGEHYGVQLTELMDQGEPAPGTKTIKPRR